jgi:uncharacterized membrane protein YobD (UPF0266 family)
VDSSKGLPTGSKLVLASSGLLFCNLFFTWQTLAIDFGRAGMAERSLDGWDFWGLMIGLLTLALISLTVLVHASDVDLPPEVPWDSLALGLGLVVFLLTLVKNLTDSGSTLPSYVGVGLGALVVVGAYLSWTRAASRQPSPLGT